MPDDPRFAQYLKVTALRGLAHRKRERGAGELASRPRVGEAGDDGQPHRVTERGEDVGEPQLPTGRVAPPDRRADVLSSFYVVTYLGTGLPVIGVGFLATALGLLPAVRIFAIIAGTTCLVTLAIRIRARNHAVTHPACAPTAPTPGGE